MPIAQYAVGEIVEKGKRIYEAGLKPALEAGNKGRYLVIDVETGDYELGDDILTLMDALHAKRTDAPLYVMRIGYPAASRIGSFHTKSVS